MSGNRELRSPAGSRMRPFICRGAEGTLNIHECGPKLRPLTRCFHIKNWTSPRFIPRFSPLEHGLSNEPGIQKRQRRLNGLQRLLGENCQLVRNIRELVRQQPFQSVELDEFYLEKTPKTHGYMYRGVAIK